ncbi:MAG: ribbon-helix-helix protein, CopG family [Patescibacteria group bacterium]
MEIKFTLPKELYEWTEKTAKESNKTVEQFIEEAIRFYKTDIDLDKNSNKQKKRDFRFK